MTRPMTSDEGVAVPRYVFVAVHVMDREPTEDEMEAVAAALKPMKTPGSTGAFSWGQSRDGSGVDGLVDELVQLMPHARKTFLDARKEAHDA